MVFQIAALGVAMIIFLMFMTGLPIITVLLNFKLVFIGIIFLLVLKAIFGKK